MHQQLHPGAWSPQQSLQLEREKQIASLSAFFGPKVHQLHPGVSYEIPIFLPPLSATITISMYGKLILAYFLLIFHSILPSFPLRHR
jgi:hypothetical protein